MAQIVTITNPLTGQPAQVDQLDHTAQEIDDVIYQVLGGGGIGSEKLLALAAAVPYSTSQTYALGAYCTRAGKLYRCTTTITTTETWTEAHWTETTVGAELAVKAPLESPAFTGSPTVNGLPIGTGEGRSINQNLLDNWYFGNPVNQRNVSETIDTVGYFLDRWKLVSGSVTIGSNGITLNGTIVQILEMAVGTDVTASALTTEGVVDASYDNNSKTFSLTSTGQTFIAAKLELGDHQTLANQDADGNWAMNEIPDYGEQLRRCQRYFVNFNPYKMYWFAMQPAVSSGETLAYSPVTLPVAMRAEPVVSYSGNIVLSQSSDIPVTSITVAWSTFTGNSVNLQYGTDGGLTANSLYRVQSKYDSSAYIWLSADL